MKIISVKCGSRKSNRMLVTTNTYVKYKYHIISRLGYKEGTGGPDFAPPEIGKYTHICRFSCSFSWKIRSSQHNLELL